VSYQSQWQSDPSCFGFRWHFTNIFVCLSAERSFNVNISLCTMKWQPITVLTYLTSHYRLQRFLYSLWWSIWIWIYLHSVNPSTGWHHRIWNKSSTDTQYLYNNSFAWKVNKIIIQY
jgi:hypothetical protein